MAIRTPQYYTYGTKITIARELYQTDDIEIDDDAKVLLGDDGYWVQAWVLVSPEDELRAAGFRQE